MTDLQRNALAREDSMRFGPRPVDLRGRRFGSLNVVELGPRNASGLRWLCRCDCGGQALVTTSRLNTLQATRCRRCAELAVGVKRRTHGHSVGAGTKRTSRTYQTWRAMRMRCENPLYKNWPNYGGRGITICERWLSFENFLADMGERPDGKTLDRYPDSDGNYEPGNCRWATPAEQVRNSRTAKLTVDDVARIRALIKEGRRHRDIALLLGVTSSTVSYIGRGDTWR